MILRFLRIALVTDPLAAFIVVTMGCSSFVAFLKDRTGDLSHRVVSFWGRALLRVSGVRLEKSGLDKIPKQGGLVLVSNHRSLMDIPTLMAALPVSFRFMAKKSLFRTPFIGWHLYCGRHIKVDRADRRAAAAALGEARRLIKRGTSVLVFAEGSRSSGELRAFKAGAAHLAIKTGATIVPIGMTGTDRALPRGSVHIRPARLTVRVGDPVPTAGLSRRDGPAITERVRRQVAELIATPEANAP